MGVSGGDGKQVKNWEIHRWKLQIDRDEKLETTLQERKE